MAADELVRKRQYRIKDTFSRVCDGPMTYQGTQIYRGAVFHDFFDPVLRLHHWIDPETVEEVAQ